MAMLELTVNTHIILPGMLTVIIASMTSRHLFGCEGAFTMLLKARGLDYSNHPIAQSLRRAAVLSVMSSSFVRLPVLLKVNNIDAQLTSKPRWIVVQEHADDEPTVLQTADLALALKKDSVIDIKLLEIPAQRIECECINSHATLQQAYDRLLASDCDMLCVVRHYHRSIDGHKLTRGRVIGILTRDMISSYYKYP